MGAVGLILLVGCSQTATATTTTLEPLTQGVTTTTTIVLSTQPPDEVGFVGNVYDGQSFDLQVGQTIVRHALRHVAVAGMGTCEGQGARSLLAQLIAGKQVRIDADGVVWRDDLDVAKALVAFGYAKANDDRYAITDAQSNNFACT